MKYLKLFNESFMSDYQKLSDDFDRMKSEFQKNRLQLWNEHSLILDQIFYDLQDYTNDFFSKYRSSTGGMFNNYLEFLEILFTKYYGDKNFYNQRLRNDNFFFDCMDESTENVSGWKNDGKSLTGEFIFQSFESARQFINQVATESESQNHHPKIEWMFDKVTLTLSTHDAGDVVTEKDINLANSINEIYENNQEL